MRVAVEVAARDQGSGSEAAAREFPEVVAARVARAARVALEAVASPLIPVICGVHRSRLAAAEESPESRAAEVEELGVSAAALQAAVLREQRQQSQENG